MHRLHDVLTKAQQTRTALGHFNIADLVLLKGVFAAARDVNLPVLVGTSEGERSFFGTLQVAALVRSLREEFDFPIFLNADHTHSIDSALEAARAGFDSVVFDLSTLQFDENARRTKECVEQLKAVNPSILVEGEIGDIGSGSQIQEKIPESASRMTTAEEARQFVEFTGVDVLAPAVGNMHGMLKSMVRGEDQKHLDIERIQRIKAATGVFLTLHGGSGTADEDFRKAIAAGINIVHINTELRLSWRNGLEESLAMHRNEIVPYKILPSAVESVQRAAGRRLKLFSGI